MVSFKEYIQESYAYTDEEMMIDEGLKDFFTKAAELFKINMKGFVGSLKNISNETVKEFSGILYKASKSDNRKDKQNAKAVAVAFEETIHDKKVESFIKLVDNMSKNISKYDPVFMLRTARMLKSLSKDFNDKKGIKIADDFIDKITNDIKAQTPKSIDKANREIESTDNKLTKNSQDPATELQKSASLDIIFRALKLGYFEVDNNFPGMKDAVIPSNSKGETYLCTGDNVQYVFDLEKMNITKDEINKMLRRMQATKTLKYVRVAGAAEYRAKEKGWIILSKDK